MPRRYTGGFLSAKEQATDTTTANGVFTVQEAGALTAAGSFPTGRWMPQRSLRLRSVNSAFLSRTPGSASNRKTWTWSTWVKKTQTDANATLFAARTAGGGTYLTFVLSSAGDFRMESNSETAYPMYKTNALFRDPAAWYHIVVACDMTQAIALNRIKVYVNGVRQSAASYNVPAQNTDLAVNSTETHIIGQQASGGYLDGYLSEVNFINGLALDPSFFGMTDPSTGMWVPKQYSGAYSTNGFYLNFSDVSSTTSGSNAGIGKDYSGNGNYFNTSNVQVAGGDYWDWDQMYDVPGLGTNSPGRQNRGNYPIVNWNWKHANISSTQAGLYVYNNTTADYRCAWFTTVIPPAGKYYWEVTLAGAGDVMGFGIAPTSQANASNALNGNFVNIAGKTPGFYSNYSGAANGYFADSVGNAISVAANDVINFAYDAATGELWIGKNGTYYTLVNGVHGSTSAGTGRASRIVEAQWRAEGMVPYFMAYNGTGTGIRGGIFNFGQKDFRYTPPAGFATLCTTSMPDPIIKRPEQHFNVSTYTGTGLAQQIGTTAKQTPAFPTSALRFRKASTQTLNKPFAGAPTSRTTMTMSAWVKRGSLSAGTTQAIFGTANNYENVTFFTDDTIRFTGPYSSGQQGAYITNQRFADTSAWYHIVAVYDTTNVGSMERMRLYVNGARITSFGTATASNQSNTTTEWLVNGFLSGIGTTGGSGSGVPFDGIIAEVNVIDGQALAPTAFGVFDANNNWVPQRYTGTYGNNGFYLPLSRPTNTDVMSFGTQMIAGSGQYLQAPSNTAFQFGTGDFTVEMYVYHTTSGTQATYYGDTPGNTSGPYFYRTTSNTIAFYTSSQLANSTATIPVNQWVHVAVTRSGTSLRLFMDGKIVATVTDSTNLSDTNAFIGNDSGGSGQFVGFISNVRVVKGTAVYTANFTKPSSNLTAISGTSLLTCQSATIVDASTNAFTITNTGTVTVVDAAPWQRTVGYDASGNGNDWYLTNYDYSVPRSTVVTYATPGSYTWVAPAGVTSVKALVIAGGGAGGSNGGGGGAGGMIYNDAVSVTPGSSYTVTVGKGGRSKNRANAGNSVFSSLTAIAGGNGANHGVVAAQNGGSGGGGHFGYNTPGTGTAGQGNSVGVGNNGNSGNTYYGAGGGGAGGVGLNAGDSRGGPGLLNSITGVPLYYAGGGGGNFFITNVAYRAAGGIGGGGSGANGVSGILAGGINGTGAGGGATSADVGGGPGGTGVVILSYTNAGSYTGTGANSFYEADSIFNTPTDSINADGTVDGNYAIVDATQGDGGTVTFGGLAYRSPATDQRLGLSTLNMANTNGKFYCEITMVASSATYYQLGVFANSTAWNPRLQYRSDGYAWIDDTNVVTNWASYTDGDVIGIAFDSTTATASFYKNGTLQGSLPYVGTNFRNTWKFGAGSDGSGGQNDYLFNFGQRPFQYSVPSGHLPLSSSSLKQFGGYNLPDNFGNYVNTPDLVWVKNRTTGGSDPVIYDTTRGPQADIRTSSTAVSAVYAGYGVQSFLPNGFQVYGNGNLSNAVGDSYVSWNWNKSKIAGFDIVTYGGNGTAGRQIPHNLGVAPSMIITKNIGTIANWGVYHKAIGTLSNTTVLYLNDSTYLGQITANLWNSTQPGTNYFTVGDTSVVNASGSSYIAYLWTEVPGFSKFGAYIGNGAASGPFVYTGFKPAFLMVKGITGTEEWTVVDSKRDASNTGSSARISVNSTAAESPAAFANFFSNGFQAIRSGDGTGNVTNRTYAYVAFAEAPFKYTTAR